MDRDSNTYKTVVIGSQCWMAENLRTTRFDDGTEIPYVTSGVEWGNLSTPAWCWYNNSINYGNTYGSLYNWFTVNTGNPCPTGWHVPSEDDWSTAFTYLGETVAGGKLKEAGTDHWQSPNTGATNEKGFTALPGGYRLSSLFNDIYLSGKWWSTTGVVNTSNALYLSMYYTFSQACIYSD